MSFLKKEPSYSRVPLLTGDEEDSEEELFERVKKGPLRKDNAIAKVKQELQSTVNLMKNNLHKVIDRGEKLEDLEAKSETFEMNASEFKSRSTKLRKKMWWQQCKLKLVFGLIITGVLTVVIVSLVLKNKKSQ
ncbi:vesicle-associated membrane protein 4 isoform X2 [Hydra vulgaris]|uniref:vesicle-associated membrane protein 4 isoform X2 n=1 Tax=Hydra vulgaris TaxID=6087 RepID=UPI001F5E62CB|nr:vesicle-associated membrane protein 4 isoform X2 [Hydra vulgaris]